MSTAQYLLDSNIVIALMKGHAGVHQRLQRHSPAQIAISSIVLHELYFGAYKSQRQEANLLRVGQLQLEVLDFDAQDARAAGQIRATLSAAGTPIGPYDVLIAGQALSRGLVLVSNNGREFSRITTLRVEDWL